MRRDKKTPKDYPPFVFRLSSQKEKSDLEKSVKTALRELNKGLSKKQRKFTKSEVAHQAIKKGLEIIKNDPSILLD